MSKFTEFLNLFKWDSVEDAEEEFDIDKELNDNWDKIDTKLKDHISNINTNLSNLKKTTNDAISTKANSTDVYTKTELDTKINAKQDKLSAGNNITIANNTISAKDTTYSTATSSTDGLMSKTDKSKLDGLSNYNDTTIKNEISTLKTSKQDKLIAGTNITISNNTISAKSTTSTTYSTATSSADGLMSKTDKSKLDNIFNSIYPVGSIYMSVNSTNPSTLFGGTWTRIANGRTLIGVDENNGNFNSVKKTGGSFSHNHTNPSTGSHILTLNEMPNRLIARINLKNSTDMQHDNTYIKGDGWKNICLEDAVNTKNISQVGLGHNHTMGNTGTTTTIPQYFTCYIWQRTA